MPTKLVLSRVGLVLSATIFAVYGLVLLRRNWDAVCIAVGRATIRVVKLIVAAVPDLLILAGVGLVLAGVYLLLGLAVVLILAGLLLAGYGVALEFRPVRRAER